MNTEAPARRGAEAASAASKAEDRGMKDEWGFAFDLDVKAVTDEGEFTGLRRGLQQ